jgi:predicted adenine nucleotide alpha hydrolase (AANH) superfamily ATPase
MESWAGTVSLDLTVEDGYPLEDNLKLLLSSDPRCRACYRDRLRATAGKAIELGCDVFSTTLTVSPWQDHNLLREAGASVAEETGIAFLYRDFRPMYEQSAEVSSELGLYRQPYCGCIMSERDRYCK